MAQARGEHRFAAYCVLPTAVCKLFRGGVSSGNNLVLHQVKANEPRSRLGVEVATHRIADHLPEFIQRLGFREDGVPQSARPGLRPSGR